MAFKPGHVSVEYLNKYLNLSKHVYLELIAEPGPWRGLGVLFSLRSATTRC
jgi:hypothetical protein